MLRGLFFLWASLSGVSEDHFIYIGGFKLMGRSTPWQKWQREVWRVFGGYRASLGEKGPDFLNDTYVGECKYGKQCPPILWRWIDQAKGYSKTTTPVLFLRKPKDSEPLVVVPYAHFVDLTSDKQKPYIPPKHRAVQK